MGLDVNEVAEILEANRRQTLAHLQQAGLFLTVEEDRRIERKAFKLAEKQTRIEVGDNAWQRYRNKVGRQSAAAHKPTARKADANERIDREARELRDHENSWESFRDSGP